MDEQRAALRLRVVPGLVVICLYLAATLYQNGLVLRFSLEAWQQMPEETGWATGVLLYIVFALAELVLAFAAVALLALVRRPAAPIFGGIALLLVGIPGGWLENLALIPWREDRPILVIGGAPGFIELALTAVAAVWLLKSRNVRDFFDHRLVARTFD